MAKKEYKVDIKLNDGDSREFEIVDCLRGVFSNVDREEVIGYIISKDGIKDKEGKSIILKTNNKESIQDFNFKLKRIK